MIIRFFDCEVDMAAKLIVALDVKSFDEAKIIIDDLGQLVEYFKIGSILYTLEGKKLIDYIHSKNRKVFLDLKFFDIPNTVKEVSFAAAQLGVEMFTIHLLGGQEMIKAALAGVQEGCSRFPKSAAPLVLGVTVLTSMNDQIIRNEMKINYSVAEMVSHLARMGYNEGIRGFVCSPFEIENLKRELGKDITLVTPGVRLPGESLGDQKRVMTPAQAKEKGTDYIVMGRSVTGAANKKAVVENILKELE
jgi:orotidine-5'-phosphate decarboxylase